MRRTSDAVLAPEGQPAGRLALPPLSVTVRGGPPHMDCCGLRHHDIEGHRNGLQTAKAFTRSYTPCRTGVSCPLPGPGKHAATARLPDGRPASRPRPFVGVATAASGSADGCASGAPDDGMAAMRKVRWSSWPVIGLLVAAGVASMVAFVLAPAALLGGRLASAIQSR